MPQCALKLCWPELLTPGRFTHARQVEGERPDEESSPGLTGSGLGLRPATVPQKNSMLQKSKLVCISDVGQTQLGTQRPSNLLQLKSETRIGYCRRANSPN